MSTQGKSYRPRKTKAEWKQLITAGEHSSLPSVTFCEQQDISYSSFMKWRSTFRAQERQSKQSFLEITPSSDSSTPNSSAQAWDIELSLGGNIILRLRQGA